MASTYITDLTSPDNYMRITSPNTEARVIGYTYSRKSGEIGTAISIDIALRIGDPLEALDPGSDVVLYFMYRNYYMRVTDVNRTASAQGGWTMSVTLVDQYSERMDRRPLRPIKFMSLKSDDYYKILKEARVSGTLDYEPLIKMDRGGTTLGWRFSQVLRALASLMGFDLTYSASFDYWVKSVDVNETFFSAFTGLINKYGFELVHVPTSRLVVVDMTSARYSGLRSASVWGGAQISEDMSDLKPPSSIILRGNSTTFTPRYYKGYSLNQTSISSDPIMFGDFTHSGDFISFDDGTSPETIVLPWANAYKMTTSGLGSKTYTETLAVSSQIKTISEDVLSEIFGTDNTPEGLKRTAAQDDQKLSGEYRTLQTTKYLIDFFGQIDPVAGLVPRVFVGSLGGHPHQPFERSFGTDRYLNWCDRLAEGVAELLDGSLIGGTFAVQLGHDHRPGYSLGVGDSP